MAKNPLKVSLVSPKGVSQYPKLNAPDYKFNVNGKFSLKLALDGSDPTVQAFVAKLEAMRDSFFDAEIARLKSEKKAALAAELGKDPVVKVERDNETGEETGMLIFSASMTASGVRKDGTKWEQKPTIFDAKGTKLENPPAIYGGTVAKAGFDAEPFVNQTSKKVVISTRLTAAQIIKLVTGGERSFDSIGFTEEEGDEIADGNAPSPFTDDAAAPGNDDL